MTDPTPQTTHTRDEAVPIGYMRPADKDGNSFWCSRQKSAYYTDPVFASAPAPASGGVDAVAVKALEWSEQGLSHSPTWRAESSFGRYLVYMKPDNSWAFEPPGRFGGKVGFKSPNDAMAAAQSEHDQNIRSALSPAATPVSCTYCGDTRTVTDRVDGEITCPECGYDKQAATVSEAGDKPFWDSPPGRWDEGDHNEEPAATPVSEAEPVAFPADGELLNMEDGERANAFWRWSKAAGLPLHMAESGLNRFHADDRAEWAWQAWCAALAKPASSPAGGDVREAAQHAVELEQCSLFVDSPPLAKAMTDAAKFLRALSQSTSAGRGV